MVKLGIVNIGKVWGSMGVTYNERKSGPGLSEKPRMWE
jgi:hypothetical protein